MIDGYGSGSIGIEDGAERKARKRLEGAIFLDGHQLLEDMQGIWYQLLVSSMKSSMFGLAKT